MGNRLDFSIPIPNTGLYPCTLYNKDIKPKDYIETSVISYLTARSSRDIIIAANQQATQEWWHTRKPDSDIYISQLIVQEASSGDIEAISKRQEVLENLALLDISDESVALAENLVKQRAIPEQAAEHALHIALATVNGMDYLVTWNFKHIANAAMRANVRLNDYEPPIICTPLELMEV